MRGFRAARGSFVAELDPDERAAIGAVVADVADLLGGDTAAEPGTPTDVEPFAGLRMRTTDIDPPTDAAVLRMLPDASTDDPEVSAEFRRLTEDDLRLAKTARLEALARALEDGPGDGWPDGSLVVDPAHAAELAATLTDVRLVLAERLGLTDDEQSEALYAELEASDQAGGTDTDEDHHAAARRYLGAIYAALSWLQESLLTMMLEDLDQR